MRVTFKGIALVALLACAALEIPGQTTRRFEDVQNIDKPLLRSVIPSFFLLMKNLHLEKRSQLNLKNQSI